jgi:hypothetical protein
MQIKDYSLINSYKKWKTWKIIKDKHQLYNSSNVNFRHNKIISFSMKSSETKFIYEKISGILMYNIYESSIKRENAIYLYGYFY